MRGFYIVDFHSALSWPGWEQDEWNLQCKNPSFLTKWWDLLDLSKKKILLDLVYMHPGGVRIATDLFLFWKNAIVKQPTLHRLPVTDIERGLNKWLTDPLSLFLPLSLSCSAWYTMWQACGHCGARLIPVVRVLNITSVCTTTLPILDTQTEQNTWPMFDDDPIHNTHQYLMYSNLWQLDEFLYNQNKF